MIIADTSGLLALFNKQEPSHTTIAAYVHQTPGPLIISPFVLAELDYLVATRLGVDAELTVLKELASGAYDIATLNTTDLTQCADIINTYKDQSIGLTDASLVLLADRHQTKSILTLDHRHFNVLRPLTGGTFELPT